VPAEAPVVAEVPADPASVAVILATAEGVALAAAEFALLSPSGVELGRVVTNVDGFATFPTVPVEPGEFCVLETANPAGYAPVDESGGVRCFPLEPGAAVELVFTNGAVVGRRSMWPLTLGKGIEWRHSRPIHRSF